MSVQRKSCSTRSPRDRIEICILAGGLGTRMGLDKARLRLGSRSLLARVRAVAGAAGRPARVVRRDLVRRSGPLGGICTALLTSRADAVLFLSCDMPFVLPETLKVLLRRTRRAGGAVFVESSGRVGFPFVIRRAALPVILRCLAGQHLSLQGLARALRSRRIRLSGSAAHALFNINTPADLKVARRIQREHDSL